MALCKSSSTLTGRIIVYGHTRCKQFVIGSLSAAVVDSLLASGELSGVLSL